MTAPNDIWAVVPVKEIALAKQRLGAVLTLEQRGRLVLAMLIDVLTALAAVKELAGTIVVTLDPEVQEVALGFGARMLTAGAREGYSGAVNAAARVLSQEGQRGMLAVPADIPLATADEFSMLLRTHPEGRALSIVPAHDGRGTNAVLLTPPRAMALEYEGDSYLRHVRLAERAGLPNVTRRLRGIGRDMDIPADLEMLRAGGTSTHAARVLASAQ